MCHKLNDKAFGYLKRVIVTPAVYPRLVEFLHFDIQSTGQKSHCVNTRERHHNAWFLLNCRIPLVRFSSELAANCTGGPQRSDFRRYPAHELPRNRSISLVFTPGSCTQPSEPILFPKLRIYFADFPYLLYSIDQRLLTLEA